VPWTVAAVAACIAAAPWLRPTPPASQALTPIRFSLSPPPGGAFYESYENTGLSVSPDGSRLAFTARDTAGGLRLGFTARDASGPMRIWMRGVAELDAKPVAGTEGATSLFWSPDGRSLAFFAGEKLRRIDLPSGTPVSICDVREGIGFAGTWGADGRILFSSIEGETLYRVAASGGTAQAALKPDPARGEARLNWPFFLPDGRRFLYLQRRRDGSGHLLLADPDRATQEVRPMQSSAQYVAPGYLVFASEGALVGQRFDLSRGIVVGDPFSIADSVGYFLTTTVARFSTSPTGTLVYTSHDDEQRLVWFDSAGRELDAVGEPGRYQRPRISPDGRRVVFSRVRGGANDLWEADLERQVETRLTMGESSENSGPWMPDGRSLFFSADIGAPPRIFRKNLITGREELVLPGSGTFQDPEDISPDGRTLLFTQRAPGGGDIWMFTLDGSRPPAPIGTTPSDEAGVRFSPDGRFFSFHSNASGRYEVYAAPFPPTGEKARMSTAGGTDGRWSHDGRTLFYRSADSRLMAVPIETRPSLRVGSPKALFEMKPSWAGFEVSSSGRFLAVVPVTRASEQPLTVVLNWQEELKQRVPTR
jgi:Tol biopolymer transport system component